MQAGREGEQVEDEDEGNEIERLAQERAELQVAGLRGGGSPARQRFGKMRRQLGPPHLIKHLGGTCAGQQY